MKNNYRPAVFVVVYKRESDKIFYLVLKRKKHWKGWEFTKGGIERGENAVKTAKREVKEESGLKPLKLSRFNIRGKYNYSKNFKDRPGFIGQTYQLFAAEVKENKKIKLDKKEHSAYKWLEFTQARDILTWSNQKKCLSVVNKFLKK